jgi:hypothetical protein
LTAFPHLPVTDFSGCTQNFEKLLPLLSASEEPATRGGAKGASRIFYSEAVGSITTSSSTAVALTSGPTIHVPSSGGWLVGLSLFMQAQAEGLTGLEAFIVRSGVSVTGPGRHLYAATHQTFDGGIFSATWPAALSANDALSVFVATSAKVSASFSTACITLQLGIEGK